MQGFEYNKMKDENQEEISAMELRWLEISHTKKQLKECDAQGTKPPDLTFANGEPTKVLRKAFVALKIRLVSPSGLE